MRHASIIVWPRSQSRIPREVADKRQSGGFQVLSCCKGRSTHPRLPGIVVRAGDSEAGGHFAQALDGFDPLRISERHAPDGGRPGGPPPAWAKAPADEDDNEKYDDGTAARESASKNSNWKFKVD